MIILGIARSAAKVIRKYSGDETASLDRMAAILALKLNTWLIIAATVLLSAFTGRLFESLIAMGVFVALRTNSGGRHMPNLDLCFLVSVSLFLTIPYIPVNNGWFMILFLICLIIFTMNHLAIARDNSKFIRVCLILLLSVIDPRHIIILACTAQAILLLRKEVIVYAE
ncbi:MAG: putative accessory regulator protein [Paenibacillaceae bacterium]|nr:putative accessory regulator protein [Paenibacillaceae bacterium]